MTPPYYIACWKKFMPFQSLHLDMICNSKSHFKCLKIILIASNFHNYQGKTFCFAMQAHSFVIIIKTFPLRPQLMNLDVLWPSKPQSITSRHIGSFKSQSWIATWSSFEWFWKAFHSFPHSSYLVWKCISLHETHTMFQPFFLAYPSF